MQSSTYYTFLEVLRIKPCELWEMKENRGFLKCTGSLQLVYSKNLDLFVLKLGDCMIALDKSLQVFCSVGEKNEYRSYMIPNEEGFFTIKLLDTNQQIAIQNLETVLSTCCKFHFKSGLEQELGFTKEKQIPPPDFIEKTGELLVEGLVKLGEVVSKGVALIHHGHETDVSQRFLRSFDELKECDSKSNPVVDIPISVIEKVRSDIKDIPSKHQTSPEKRLKREDELTDISKLDLGPRIAGQGLTSQSMGEDTGAKPSTYKPVCGDNINTTWQKNSPDNQEVIGTEGQRLPTYEVQSTKNELKEGLNQISTNLGEGTEKPESVPTTEDTSFTSGLMSEGQTNFGPHEIGKDLKDQPKEVFNGDDLRPDIINEPESETKDFNKSENVPSGQSDLKTKSKKNKERRRKEKSSEKRPKEMSPVKEENPETIDV